MKIRVESMNHKFFKIEIKCKIYLGIVSCAITTVSLKFYFFFKLILFKSCDWKLHMVQYHPNKYCIWSQSLF